ncbi:MAG: shikimate kinase [Cyanobacteria bacterium P01_A01_bin.3]
MPIHIQNKESPSQHFIMTAPFHWTDLQAALRGTSIYLVGMMGAGKTTVGRALAEQLGYRFLDTDTSIEAVAQQPIPEIFAQQGEDAFRDIESKVLQELSQYPRMVISTGGGAVLRKTNWADLRNGIVVWLDVPAPILVDRLKADATPRPLLQTDDPVATLTDLLDQRRSRYALADVCVHCDTQTPQELLPQLGYQVLKQLQMNAPESAKVRPAES